MAVAEMPAAAALALKLKGTLDDKDVNDEWLEALCDAAQWAVLAYTRRNSDAWLKPFDAVAVTLAQNAYNRRGAEGISSQSAGKLATTFNDKADKDALSLISGYRLAGVGL